MDVLCLLCVPNVGTLVILGITALIEDADPPSRTTLPSSLGPEANGAKLRGTADGFQIGVVDPGSDPCTRRLEISGGQPGVLRIRRRGFFDGDRRAGEDISTGDVGFDGVVMLGGEPCRCCARGWTKPPAVNAGAELNAGRWTVTIGAELSADSADYLIGIVPGAARALTGAEAPVQRLSGRAGPAAVPGHPEGPGRDPRCADPRRGGEDRAPALARRRGPRRPSSGGPRDRSARRGTGSRRGRGGAARRSRRRPRVLDALERIGTVTAVPALGRLGGDRARQAIRAIQARIVGAERGSLALADDSAGRLSVSRRPTGGSEG